MVDDLSFSEEMKKTVNNTKYEYIAISITKNEGTAAIALSDCVTTVSKSLEIYLS